MGLDGGTKISRSDVLRGASWRLTNADTSRSTRGGAISTTSVHQEQRQKPSVVKKNRLSSCFLSSRQLTVPLVCDYVGNLYSKASVVEYLLWKKNKLDESEDTKHKYQNIARIHGEGLNHLKSLKDVLDVSLVPENLAQAGSEKPATRLLQTGSVVDLYAMQCPVLNTPFDKDRVILLPCGHVVGYGFQLMQIEAESEAADAECPLTGCGQSYKNSQVIELAPEEGSAEHKVAVERLRIREALKASNAASKKRKLKQIHYKGGGEVGAGEASHSKRAAKQLK